MLILRIFNSTLCMNGMSRRETPLQPYHIPIVGNLLPAKASGNNTLNASCIRLFYPTRRMGGRESILGEESFVKKYLFQLLCLSCFLFSVVADAKSTRLSDNQVRQMIIEESIAGYSGNCACPYSSARNGSRCGGRSAWSRKGGAAPACYKDDVTNEQVARWREQNKERTQ